MSDLEFFNPGEGGESYDPAAFERFKEQIKKNAAFVAAMRKGEQKQKQKEDKLAKILLKFIQTNQKQGILLLAAKLLEENIPPSFILSVIILGNEDLKKELQNAQEAPAGSADVRKIETAVPVANEFSLMASFTDKTLPLKLKIEIDEWGKGIFEAGSAVPFRVLETATDKEGKIKRVLIDCTANVLQDFMESNGQAGEAVYDTFFSFCEFLIKGIFKKLREQLENQKELN